MVPAEDEFKEKRNPRGSSLSGPTLPIFRVRVRRSRRVTYFLVAFILISIYKIIGFFTRWPPIQSPEYQVEELEDFPWGDYTPTLSGDDEARQKNLVIKFPDLYSTLGRGSSAGFKRYNRIVLFAASNLRSASNLAGMACEMALEGWNVVHLALLGKEDIPIKLFEKMNGLGAESQCKVHVHDARPQNTTDLTEEQMQMSVRAALKHVYRFLHPQAILIDTEHEKHLFREAVRSKASELETTLIELPGSAAESMRWVTKLNSHSLKAWNNPKYEVLIRADNHQGNLIRLLQSLRSANYFGIIPSRLTIEFDPSHPIDIFTRDFLQSFSWPSRDRVTIRYPSLPETDNIKKIIYFVDSFYPPDMDTGILLLDVNAELSPYYIHWLHYATLNYRHSMSYLFDTAAIMGISLISPKTFINGTLFEPNLEQHGPFLYQAPSEEAALYFPEHWAQFHAYFRHRIKGILNLSPKNSQSVQAPAPNMTIPNVILSSQVESSWLLYLTELIQARGFVMLYPSWGLNIPTDKPYVDEDVIAIVHEEEPSYTRPNKKGRKKELREEPHVLSTNAFSEMLPDRKLSPHDDLPIKNLRGDNSDFFKLAAEAQRYREQFGSNCTTMLIPYDWFDVNDLFCDVNYEADLK